MLSLLRAVDQPNCGCLIDEGETLSYCATHLDVLFNQARLDALLQAQLQADRLKREEMFEGVDLMRLKFIKSISDQLQSEEFLI